MPKLKTVSFYVAGWAVCFYSQSLLVLSFSGGWTVEQALLRVHLHRSLPSQLGIHLSCCRTIGLYSSYPLFYQKPALHLHFISKLPIARIWVIINGKRRRKRHFTTCFAPPLVSLSDFYCTSPRCTLIPWLSDVKILYRPWGIAFSPQCFRPPWNRLLQASSSLLLTPDQFGSGRPHKSNSPPYPLTLFWPLCWWCSACVFAFKGLLFSSMVENINVKSRHFFSVWDIFFCD